MIRAVRERRAWHLPAVFHGRGPNGRARVAPQPLLHHRGPAASTSALPNKAVLRSRAVPRRGTADASCASAARTCALSLRLERHAIAPGRPVQGGLRARAQGSPRGGAGQVKVPAVAGWGWRGVSPLVGGGPARCLSVGTHGAGRRRSAVVPPPPPGWSPPSRTRWPRLPGGGPSSRAGRSCRPGGHCPGHYGLRTWRPCASLRAHAGQRPSAARTGTCREGGGGNGDQWEADTARRG